MTHWQANLSILDKLLDYDRVGLITDMDGTISPIVPIPNQAAPTEHNRDLLQQLNKTLALVAVVSGRAVEDVRERVNLPELIYVGNHGLERWQDDSVVLSSQAKLYRPNLEKAIEQIKLFMPDGMWVEDKHATISVHYRDTPLETAEHYAPRFEEIAISNDLKLFQGRMIFELRPPLNIDKGTIFKQLVEEYELSAALYIGDDTTDADALKMAQHLRQTNKCYSIAVGVESDETPLAVTGSSDVLVTGVADVEAILNWLLKASSAS